jgi:ribonuclease-3
MADDALTQLEARIGHDFADRTLLTQALTHASYQSDGQSYQRLEFLGDRVLGLLLADHFFDKYPDDDEGGLSLRLHAEAQAASLAMVARKLDLASHIQTQTGFDVAANHNILADVVESLLAAIYLDAGLPAARAFVMRHWSLRGKTSKTAVKDPKSRLQEWCLKRGLGLPFYRLAEKSGPEHAPELTYAVTVDGYPEITATGPNRKQAEQEAAKQMLSKLHAQNHSQEDDDE